MTKEDILTMASESYCWRINLYSDRIASIARLQRFAELVAAKERNRTWTQDHWTEYERSIAAAEREACAKLCDKLADHTAKEQDFHALAAAESCAEAIRARGQSEDS